MSATCAPMKPRRGRRFRKETKYVHHRSEGLTARRNGGSKFQIGDHDVRNR